MARMWPVDGVIGENGGFFFERARNERSLSRVFSHPDRDRAAVTERLSEIGQAVLNAVSGAEFADDHLFRLTNLAFRRPSSSRILSGILAALQAEGADVTTNNLWVMGWLGGYDKLSMTRRVLRERFNTDVDADHDAVLYVEDSANDAPMFGHFRHTVGVSTVVRHLDEIPVPPKWVTYGPGGEGFVEVADMLVGARSNGSDEEAAPEVRLSVSST